MSTRSAIAIKIENKIKGIHCHWDGYPKGVGAILNEYYKDVNTVVKLINLGDLSFLGEVPEDDPELWNNIHHSNKCCTYNGRGENTCCEIFENLTECINEAEYMSCEYIYIYDNNEWYFIDIYENKGANLNRYLKDSKNTEYESLDTLCENNKFTENDNYESINIKDIKKIQIETLIKKIFILPNGKEMIEDIDNNIYNAAKEGKNVASTLILNLSQDIKELFDLYYKALGFKNTEYETSLNQYRIFW